MSALQQVHAQSPQFLELDPKVEVTTLKHKYNTIQASISDELSKFGPTMAIFPNPVASLTFVDYTDKKNNWHRTITAKNLENVPPSVKAAFFNTLSHAVQMHTLKAQNPGLDNQAFIGPVADALPINDKDLSISEPKQNKHGVIELVASSALINGNKIHVAQDKHGVTDVVLEKPKNPPVNVDAAINTIQQKCLEKIAQFKKANEGKKIEKPVHKKDGHGHKAKHADGTKHAHGHHHGHHHHKKHHHKHHHK